jgi:hypothetical protein
MPVNATPEGSRRELSKASVEGNERARTDSLSAYGDSTGPQSRKLATMIVIATGECIVDFGEQPSKLHEHRTSTAALAWTQAMLLYRVETSGA